MHIDQEEMRIAAIRQYDVLDSPPEEHFDRFTAMAARLFDTDYACISLIDEKRFFFKSAYGVDITEIAREPGFCESTIKIGGVHCIEDANKDPLARTHSMVCGEPFIRFYAGAPLTTSDGYAIGTLCVLDPRSRKFSDTDRNLLRELSDFVMFLLDRRKLQVERERQEEQARNAQKLESLGVLTSGIAHDFNNLLVGVLGNASLAASEVNSDSPLREAITNIADAANQAKDLTGQLMVYAGQRPVSIEQFDLTNTLESMTGLMRSTIPKNTTLELDIDPRIPLAVGDETQIRQVLLNLVTNAAEAYGGSGGSINVRLTKRWVSSLECQTRRFGDLKPGQHLLLEVRDQGCGMEADTLDRMFDPYYSTKHSGRGLGMSIVQRIIKGHGGYVRIKSSPGAGCSISVFLPASLGDGLLSPADIPEHTQQLSGGGTVLVVDDEDLVVKTTCLAINRLGYDAISASSGTEALEILNDNSDFKALILDATLPEQESGAILDEIRRRRPTLPAVITSGHHVDEVASQFRDFDQLVFLPKPWTVEELAGSIGDAMTPQ